MHTDPIADMLTRIRNGIMAEKREVPVPLSSVKVNIAKILKEEGFIENFKVESDDFPPRLVITLKYLGKKRNAIEGLERVSTPGQRVYRGKDELPRVLDGLGLSIVSTSQGLLSSDECRRRGVGGEILLQVW